MNQKLTEEQWFWLGFAKEYYYLYNCYSIDDFGGPIWGVLVNEFTGRCAVIWINPMCSINEGIWNRAGYFQTASEAELALVKVRLLLQ